MPLDGMLISVAAMTTKTISDPTVNRGRGSFLGSVA